VRIGLLIWYCGKKYESNNLLSHLHGKHWGWLQVFLAWICLLCVHAAFDLGTLLHSRAWPSLPSIVPTHYSKTVGVIVTLAINVKHHSTVSMFDDVRFELSVDHASYRKNYIYSDHVHRQHEVVSQYNDRQHCRLLS
jgi:hypothetical protein